MMCRLALLELNFSLTHVLYSIGAQKCAGKFYHFRHHPLSPRCILSLAPYAPTNRKRCYLLKNSRVKPLKVRKSLEWRKSIINLSIILVALKLHLLIYLASFLLLSVISPIIVEVQLSQLPMHTIISRLCLSLVCLYLRKIPSTTPWSRQNPFLAHICRHFSLFQFHQALLNRRIPRTNFKSLFLALL